MQKVPCRYPGPAFTATPWLFVVHCGSTSGDVASFMMQHGKWTKKSTGKIVYVSAHFNWSNRLGCLTQGVPLNRVAWHVGGSRIEYNRLLRVWPEAPRKRLRKLNFCSYGMELRGPAGRKFNVGEHKLVKKMVIELRKQNPALRVATRHQDILASKKDPGKGFDMDIFKECGMVVYG
jgi:N-acetyl-anhydromuramyl-L-alanine amidase AmpD